VIAAIRAACVLALLGWLPGWAVCRALLLPADAFLRVSWSFAVASIAGLLLAYLGRFSLTALVAVIVVISLVCLAIRRVPRAVAADASMPPAADRRLAAAAALIAACWCWPPFETVIGASDSTMYLSAGVHLARTGKLSVTDTVIPLLPPELPAALFPSVSLTGSGPYIRLPGGLLMPSLHGGEATPAFFPLLSVWTGILAAVSGPTGAPAVAPLFAALSAWAVTLLAAELAGGFAGFACALLLIANYAFWWFGRFPLSEIVALAFLWGGFVALARAVPVPTETVDADARPRPREGARAYAFSAGVLVGVAGLARTETFLFFFAAAALFSVWQRARLPAGSFALGFGLPLLAAAITIVTAPSHHVAYLVNDVLLEMFSALAAFARLRASPWFPVLVAAPALLLVAAGLVGHWRSVGVARGAARALVPLAIAATIFVYARLGGEPRPVQHAGWLAAYCSWPLLAVAILGCGALWLRGGPAERLLLTLVAIVAVVFVINPRVAPSHPWAIRRFLPVVIPAVALTAATALALLARRGRALRAVAVLLAIVLATIELRPVLAMRRKPLYAESFATVQGLAELFPEDAVVVVDSAFSDVQIQVPLWLVHGRETVVVREGTPSWRDILGALIASGRPIYFMGNQRAMTPVAPGLAFQVVADRDVSVVLPSSTGVPPTEALRYLSMVRVYAVTSAPP
jgi:hypothetical protein